MAIVPWDDEQKHQFLTMQFTAQQSDYETRFPNATHSIIVADGQDVGRIWIDRRTDEIRLLDIAILTKYRNSGIGQIMLEQLQAEASASTTALRHSVYNTNQDALRLYERLGFVVIEDFDTHVLMEWQPAAAD
jgi:ribosomal protein S18 acetylase RimI-like enzyme